MLVGMAAGAAKALPIKVDHASVCGSQLERLRDAFAMVGLATDYGGPHAHGGTQMALLGFDDGSYLELIAPQKAGGKMDSDWGRMIEGDAGPCAWATGSQHLQEDLARFKQAGLPVEGPSPGSRKRPDGQVIEWETGTAGSGAPGSTLPFLIQDKTPRQLRVLPSASVHGSGLSGIAVVVLGVKNLEAASEQFQKAYGWQAPEIENHAEFGARLAYFAGSPVVLAAPLGEHSWLEERLRTFGESPVAYLLGTKNLAAAKARYTLSGDRQWFHRKIAWFDAKKLNGIRLGVIE